MSTNKMKNIVIIKNLPSNLVDEAIVVVKDKKMIESDCFDVIDRKQENSDNKSKKKNIIKGFIKNEEFNKLKNIKQESRSYVVKEAEMVIKEYFRKIEENKNYKKEKMLRKKYKILKYLNLILLAISIISTTCTIIK